MKGTDCIGLPRGVSTTSKILSNSEIADHLAALAQLLSANGENPHKIRAYRRAAGTIRSLSESLDELVRSDGDLTTYAGIGKAIGGAVREIVLEGSLGSLERLRGKVSPEIVAISQHPRLDPKRVLRIYKKLGISSIADLTSALESGEIERTLGARMAQHIRQGLIDIHAILLYQSHALRASIEQFLLERCKAVRAVAVGDYRRKVEVIEELVFLIETRDFCETARRCATFGGGISMLKLNAEAASYLLPSGPILRIQSESKRAWGIGMIRHTGSKRHVAKLARVTGDFSLLEQEERFATEEAVFERFRLDFIPPELREGLDEVRRARSGTLPKLIEWTDIRGDLHMHTVASDGAATLEKMAVAARERGYEYAGISDHSQSLKIANGLSIERLRQQIRVIDKLNKNLDGIRLLKSAEVDILADGSLDYPDEILRELDYTVCSIHSRFGMGREEQTERIMRAMDNRYFTILGHATGRLLLKRPGYEIDLPRLTKHAKQNRCFFEVNCSPDRLDLSAENARLVRDAGILIAISTDAHSTTELQTIRFGLEQARRAGLEKSSVLNTRGLLEILKAFAR
jgi:DNA polymerase (family 10)